MTRWFLVLVFSFLLAGTAAPVGGPPPQQQQQQTIEVYKSPTCGCCSKWIEHLRSHGFAVRATETQNVDEVKARHRVPRQLHSCHTALVAGYVIEGHVPAADVQRLLTERPKVAGLAVAGMPIGSPGMEIEVRSLRPVGPATTAGSPPPPPIIKPQPYDVVEFSADGGTRVFASHGR